jgi:hypothetical protein
MIRVGRKCLIGPFGEERHEATFCDDGVGTRTARNRTRRLSTKDGKVLVHQRSSCDSSDIMSETMLATLSNIRTVEDMIAAFRDEEHCRRLLESMVWPDGRICPACGYKRSIAIAGRDLGKRRARPGLYQCSSGDCRFQFTVTTHTPLHATKLPLRVWLKAMWLLLQSDKGLSSVRLAEILGVSQPHGLADRACSPALGGARKHARW